MFVPASGEGIVFRMRISVNWYFYAAPKPERRSDSKNR